MIVISKHCWAIDRRWSPSRSTCIHSSTVLQATFQEITGRWQVHRRRTALSSESTHNVTADSSVSISMHPCCHLQRTTCPAFICLCQLYMCLLFASSLNSSLNYSIFSSSLVLMVEYCPPTLPLFDISRSILLATPSSIIGFRGGPPVVFFSMMSSLIVLLCRRRLSP